MCLEPVSGEARHALPDSGANIEGDRLAVTAPKAAESLDLVAKVARVALEIGRLPVVLRLAVVLPDVERRRQRVREHEPAFAAPHDRRGHADAAGWAQPLAAA